MSPEENSPLTIVLTNWERQENLRLIIDQLLGQTLKPRLFLWNNKPPFSHPGIAWQADSSVNQFCWPRWWMASCAASEFAAVMDDDLIFTDPKVLADAVRFLRGCPPETATGFTGMEFIPDTAYEKCTHVEAERGIDRKVDIVKGRFLMFRTAQLEKINLRPSPEHHVRIGEDILVCGKLAEGRPGVHIVPGLFAGRWKDLPGKERGLYSLPGHWENREKARREAFKVSP